MTIMLGVYIYYALVVYKNGEEELFKRDVTLIR